MIKDAKKTDAIMKGGDYYEMAETNGFETNLENRGYFPCNGKLRDGCIRRGTIFEGHEASSRMTRRGCALYKHIASFFFS